MLATANTGKTRERFRKNADEWTGRVEISKVEIPGSKRSMYGDILTYLRLLRENLQALFSSDGTLISASAAPHCGGMTEERAGGNGKGRIGTSPCEEHFHRWKYTRVDCLSFS